jgi:hypothetical protein
MFVNTERLLQIFSKRIPFFLAISNAKSDIHDGSKFYIDAHYYHPLSSYAVLRSSNG